MIHIPGYQNVFMDSASRYTWNELNERVFIGNVLESLKKQMAGDFGKYEFYIYSNHSGHQVPASANLQPKNKVLIFISDETSSYPSNLKDSYLAVFKSYLPYENEKDPIFPFCLGYVNDVPLLDNKPVNDRQFDLFYSGNLNENRFTLYKELNPVFRWVPEAAGRMLIKFIGKLRLLYLLEGTFMLKDTPGENYIRFTHGFKEGLSAYQYGELLANSKITLCPKGFQSPETFRHIEALRAGSVVVTESLPGTRYYKNAPFILINNWKEGLQKVRQLLDDQKTLDELQQQSIKWYTDVCSENAVAKYIQDQLKTVS